MKDENISQHCGFDGIDGVSLTLFMLVTNRDCVIADYTIDRYKKLWSLSDLST